MEHKKTLPEIYKALPAATFPKKEFIEKILSKTKEAGTNRSQSTVEKWLRGSNRPSDIRDIKILCEVTGLQFDQLY